MKYILLSFLALSLVSCSNNMQLLTESIYTDIDRSGADLKQVQFYLSGDITLYRYTTSGTSSIENGKVRIVKGRKIEEIKFRKGTPGVFIFSPERSGKIAISFDTTNDDSVLMFGPNPKQGKRYVLLAKDWENGEGKVIYGDQEFLVGTNSAWAGLMVDIKKHQSNQVNRKTVKGRTI